MKVLYILTLLLILFSVQSCSKLNFWSKKAAQAVESKYYYSGEEELEPIILKEAERNGIDPIFCKAILIKESHYSKGLVSFSGAVGLMQLMPRGVSHITENYTNYMKARDVKRDKDGKRIYKEKDAEEWGKLYQKDLVDLREQYKDNLPELYKKDKRFDPAWNIRSGIMQLSDDYKFFLSRKHNEYKSKALAAAAYNGGRFAVVKEMKNPKYDSIPINHQTEFYVSNVLRMYESLKDNGGYVNRSKIWLFY